MSMQIAHDIYDIASGTSGQTARLKIQVKIV